MLSKRLSRSKLEQEDTMLYEWFRLKRSEGAPISGPMMIDLCNFVFSTFTNV